MYSIRASHKKVYGGNLTDANSAKITIDADQVAQEISGYKTTGVGAFGSEIVHPLILTIQNQSQYLSEVYGHLNNFSQGKGRFHESNLAIDLQGGVFKTFEQFPNGTLNKDFWWVTKAKPGSQMSVNNANSWYFGSCFSANKTCKRLVYTNNYAIKFLYHFDNSNVVSNIENFIKNKISNWEASCKSA